MNVEALRSLEGKWARAAVWLHDQFAAKCTNPDDCMCDQSEALTWMSMAGDLLNFMGAE